MIQITLIIDNFELKYMAVGKKIVGKKDSYTVTDEILSGLGSTKSSPVIVGQKSTAKD